MRNSSTGKALLLLASLGALPWGSFGSSCVDNANSDSLVCDKYEKGDRVLVEWDGGSGEGTVMCECDDGVIHNVILMDNEEDGNGFSSTCQCLWNVDNSNCAMRDAECSEISSLENSSPPRCIPIKRSN